MSDETTLLPCPFCGGEAEVRRLDLDSIEEGLQLYGVWCVDDLHAEQCGGWQHGHYIDNYASEAEAIAAWNTRTASGDDFSRAVHDGHLWRRCDACEGGAVPMTDEAMAAHGWVRERTCTFVGSKGPGHPPVCSECGYELGIYECEWFDDGTFYYDGNYCPNCGAKAVER